MNMRQTIPPARTGRVDAAHVSVALGDGAQAFEAIQDISFSAAPGEFVCLFGPSGCGKSTLLGALAGHIAATRGRLAIDDVAIDGPHPDRGIVFQQHTLFPWKRIIDNVAFGPKMRGVGKTERRSQAREMLELVGLDGFAAHYPAQLSGGMQQRVEIARVLVNHPRLLLMDEPFGALDAQTRRMMQELLLDIWTRVRTTVVFITHDIDEALFLADHILAMSPRPGRIVENVHVPFARPRHADLVVEPGFVRLKRHCLDLLRVGGHPGALPRLSPLGLA